ncbi:DEKNAAC102269 [Brettanomyces naardenensis]|uniref:DEKNAAC102269 n=1 Tax=Brettanomyces naardenensis TaxID=13370 RepID=A0A448YLK8_BRENA|nr:DEKNAAC102269 [Brettanomyces naardenensis]
MSSLSLDFSKSLLGTGNVELPSKETNLSLSSIKHDIRYSSTIYVASPKEAILSSGHQIWLKPKKKTDDKDILKVDESSQLIDMGKLRRKLEIDALIKKQEPSRKGRFEKTFGNGGNGTTGNNQMDNNRPVDRRKINSLWTEKYRPKSFFDLLGNENTNRRVLEWLNQWNETVFGRPTPEKLLPEYMKTSKEGSDRPFHRILLIHGAPGTGKTSIAHVIAKQLGYEISEINASDERAGTRVREKVKNSVENVSLSGKPVCLIVDEVDGASEHGFVSCLTDLLYQDRKSKGKILKRPIIAICNDVYAPALEKLRPQCEVVPFRKCNSRQIKARLRKICQKESLGGINEKVLEALVASTNGDVRSCINFLQFHGNECDDTIDGKDTQVAWYLLLGEIFSRSGKSSRQQQLEKIRKILSLAAPSVLDHVIRGCFNAMLECETASLRRLDQMSSWLYFQDSVSCKYMAFDREDIGSYGSTATMKFAQTFNEINTNSEQRLDFRSRDEFYEIKRTIREVIRWLRKNPILAGYRKNFFIGGLMPMLNYVLVPTELPLRKFEAERVSHGVEIAKSLGLYYGLESTPEEFHKKVHVFRPRLGLFLVSEDTIGKQSAYIERLQAHSIREKEAKEVEIERKRKIEEAAERNDGNSKRQESTSTIEFFRSKYQAMTEKLEKKDGGDRGRGVMGENENRIWVKYHEGFSNAVRKEITWEGLFERT